METTAKRVMLLILDGWGYSEEKTSNAIAQAHKPNFDRIWRDCPHTLLSASGLDVGLPPGQMGNSEVGHLHIGAARRVCQELTKLDLAIEEGSFFKNPALVKVVDAVAATQSALHIFGLLSEGGVHSRSQHIEAMVELAAKRGLKKIYLHAFLDGRDTPPQSALQPLESVLAKMATLGCGQVASLTGRYYAMDRDKRWDRVKLAYDLLTLGTADYHMADAKLALQAAYARGETDEFVKPTAIHGHDTPAITIQDQDAVVFMNFRADRARELSYAFTDPQFNGFARQVVPQLLDYVTMTEYASDLAATVAFPTENLTNILGEVIAQQGMTQLRIAETEKYAHVTYFINGGREAPFTGEDRILVESPKVSTYDLQPEMSAELVTRKLSEAVRVHGYNLVICNYANPDMVGHTGKLDAAIKAVEAVDTCLGQLLQLAEELNYEIVIVADHGNAEYMFNPLTHQPHTAHTVNLVPFIYVGRKAQITNEHGKLTDVATTLLYLFGIDKPSEMTGSSLVRLL